MKLTLVFLSFFSLIQFGYSQNIDSLKQRLSSIENDSLRVEALSEISYAFEPISLDSTLKYIDQAISLSNEIEDTSLWVKMSNRKAIFYVNKSFFNESFLIYENALSVFEKEPLNKNLAILHHNIAYNYYDLGQYQKSMSNLLIAKNVASHHKDTLRLILILDLMSAIRMDLKEYQSALEFQEEIVELNTHHDPKILSKAFNNIASAYQNLGKYEFSEKFHKKSIDVCVKNNLNLMPQYINLAVLYLVKGEVNKAEKYYYMSLEESYKLSEFVHPYIYTGLADCYDYKKEYDKALFYAYKAKSIGVSISDKINLKQHLLISETLALALKKNGKYKEALKEFEYSASLRDSIFNLEKTKQIFNLEAKYKKAEQDAEIVLLKKDKEIEAAKTKFNKIVGISAIIGLMLASLLAAVLYKLYKQKQISENELSKRNTIIAQEKEQAELKALLAQMNPHFISNFLNNLQVAISNNEIKESTKLTTYISKFGKLSRMILEHSNKPKVSINEELTALKLYIELEQLRTNNAFEYNIQLDPSIDQYNFTIPPMLFQPLVENAIWHGVVPLEEKGAIQIALNKEGDVIMCEVYDNGIGLHVEKSKTNNQMSMSTSIVKERLNIIWKEDNSKYGLKIENAKKGTIATFAIPINF